MQLWWLIYQVLNTCTQDTQRNRKFKTYQKFKPSAKFQFQNEVGNFRHRWVSREKQIYEGGAW